MTRTRILLLSSVDPHCRPDTDLSTTAADIMNALCAERAVEVEHLAAVTAEDVERAVLDVRPDIVFNACEALEGDSGTEPLVPLLLDRLGVEFTGGTADCLRRCLGKSHASAVLRVAGVPVPATYDGIVPEHAFPVIVKPEYEDGSVGIHATSVAYDQAGVDRAVAALAAEGFEAIVQEYVEGREIAVAFVGWPEPRILSPGEIEFDAAVFADRPRVLTYASKWDPESVDYEATRPVAADLMPEELAKLTALTRRASYALGMRDYGRVDFRVDARGRAVVIDANPNCDLSRDGGFMRAAMREGLSYGSTVRAIVGSAFARWSASGVQLRAG